MRRRGKGEASFLHCKSPGREEQPDVMNRGRGMEGEKEAKRDKRGRRVGKERERKKERWKKSMWERRGQGHRRGRRGKQGNKRCWTRAGGRGDTGH